MAGKWQSTSPMACFNPLYLEAMMFFLFSNKLGCLGSLLVSAIITLILLALLGIINFGGGRW